MLDLKFVLKLKLVNIIRSSFELAVVAVIIMDGDNITTATTELVESSMNYDSVKVHTA